MLPFDFTPTIEDDYSVASHEQPVDEDDDSAVQILGLDMINLAISAYNDYDYDSDSSDSYSDSGSFANDSIDLGNCKRLQLNRRRRRDSIDTYANDSVDIAKNQMSKRAAEEKDTIPIGMIEIVDLAPDMKTPIVVKNPMLGMKSVVAPVATPDFSTMRPKRISNSAA